MSRSAEDYQQELLDLLPPGTALPRDLDTVLAKLFLAIGDGLARVDARGDQLLDEADPRTTLELLPDWEAFAGLPDPCLGPSPTLQQRRAALVAKLTAQGGQSIEIIKAKLAMLGYPDVTIDECRPFRAGSRAGNRLFETPHAFRAGRNRAGNRLRGQDWRFVWIVRAPAAAITLFRAGMSVAGERLQTVTNDVLVCETQAVAPAHTFPMFILT